jgi:hypothetical protein
MPHELDDVLFRRAQAAIDAAERVRARSELVVDLSVAIRDGGMTTRCAWCSRYRLSRGWVAVSDAPKFLDFAAVSHGICDECVAELRAAGLSA